jgi:hypothetical protein
MIRGREVPGLRDQCDQCPNCNPVELEDVILVMAYAVSLYDMPKTRALPAPGPGQKIRGTHSITVNTKVEIIFTWEGGRSLATDLLMECRK